MKFSPKLLILALSIACASVAQAAYTSAYLDTVNGYAIWDNFGATSTFSGRAPNGAMGGFSSSTLSSTTANANMFGGGDRMYGADAGFVGIPHELSLSSSYVDTASNSILLQITISGPSDEALGATAAERALNYVDVTMNNAAATTKFVSQANSYSIISGVATPYFSVWYMWSGLTALNTGDALNFELSGYEETFGHISLDAIVISAAPEPSRAVLLLGGLGCLWMRRKRRTPLKPIGC